MYIRKGHYLYLLGIRRVRLLNGFLENCKTGEIETRVFARAIGVSEKRLIFELTLLKQVRLLEAVILDRSREYTRVVLQINYENNRVNRIEVTCPHCDGKNSILPGFVQSCEYCGGSLDQATGTEGGAAK